MKWKTLEKILLVTRLIGLLFFIYTIICFGVTEKYNLDGIGNHSAYKLYWNILVACCLFLLFDCVAQIIKVANPQNIAPYIIQAILYTASVALVIIMIANYPNLVCDGNRIISLSFWSKAVDDRLIQPYDIPRKLITVRETRLSPLAGPLSGRKRISGQNSASLRG
ncbi:MAG: hypothetical protein IKZ50_07205 [Bacteroidales bacterium]|nr:hypothetical protein [Bacteroidales bacterium]